MNKAHHTPTPYTLPYKQGRSITYNVVTLLSTRRCEPRDCIVAEGTSAILHPCMHLCPFFFAVSASCHGTKGTHCSQCEENKDEKRVVRWMATVHGCQCVVQTSKADQTQSLNRRHYVIAQGIGRNAIGRRFSQFLWSHSAVSALRRVSAVVRWC